MKTANHRAFAVTCLSIISLMAVPQATHAFSIALEGGAPTFSNTDNTYTYNYTITLDSNDSLEGDSTFNDLLDFFNLGGVTSTTADSPYSVLSSSKSAANFEVISDTTGETTLTNVVTLVSANDVGFVDYTVSYSDGGTPTTESGTILGPAPVPYDFPGSMGFLLAIGLGWQRYRRNLKLQTQDNA